MPYQLQNAIYHKPLPDSDPTFLTASQCTAGFAPGYDTGTPDGMAGPKTRQATRKFQSDIGFVADGYVGYELFQQLQ